MAMRQSEPQQVIMPHRRSRATVRLRTKVTKGPDSRAAGIAMAYRLIEVAQTRWRAVNAPHLVALVRAGAVFHKGKLLERPIDITPAELGESSEQRWPETPPRLQVFLPPTMSTRPPCATV